MEDTLRSKRAVALRDVRCVGLTIKEGQTVNIRLQYSDIWLGSGFRTIIGGTGSGLAWTDGEAYYTLFSEGV